MYNPTSNYAHIPLVAMPTAESGIMQGLEDARARRKEEQERQSAIFLNQLKQAQMKKEEALTSKYGKEEELLEPKFLLQQKRQKIDELEKRALMQQALARTEKARSETVGIPGKQELEQLLKKSKIKLNEQKGEYFSKGGSRSGNIWNHLPLDIRRDLVAEARGFGISPEQISEHINNGGTMEELREEARKNGVDVDNSEKIYAATQSDVSKLHTRQSKAKELEVISEKVEKDTSKIGATFSGYSPELISNMMKAKAGNKEAEQEAIDVIGGYAMSPEITSVRISTMQGPQGIELMNEAQRKALLHLKVPESLLTPSIRAGVHKYMNDLIQKGVEASAEPITGQKRKKNTEKFKNIINKPSSEDLENTARKYGTTVEEVKKRLGL
jgi:hypothetical protein